MVAEVGSNYDSQWGAINAVAQKLGVRQVNDRLRLPVRFAASELYLPC